MSGKDFEGLSMIIKSTFLQIMNRFIHPEAPAPAVSQLQTREIGELFRLARLHALYPAVYEAVQTAPAYLALPEEERRRRKQQTLQMVISQTQRTFHFLRIYQALLDQGLTPLVVKGLVLRSLYEKPDYRASSDEDLLIRREDFFRVDAALKAMGFTRDEVEKPQEQHEITFLDNATGVHLEIHMSLFPEQSGAYGRLNREFTQVFDHSVVQTIQGVPIHTLEPTEHMLYLLCHGLKHFLHSGFGIRQLCDMIVFAEAYGEKIDWARVEEATRRQNMYVFWMNLFDIGQRCLGFSWEKAGLQRPENVDLDSEAMLDDLLCSGIYGKSTENRVHSANITLQAAQSGHRSAMPLASLFPGLSYMQRSYPYLKRHKWLLPAAWVQRGAGYLRKAGKQDVSAVLDTGNYRVGLMKKYGIIGDTKK